IGSITEGTTLNVDTTGMSVAQQAASVSTSSLVLLADAVVAANQIFTVDIDLTAMPVPAIGLQAAVQYDTAYLEYVPSELGIGGTEFPFTILEMPLGDDMIAFATGVDLGGTGNGILSGNVARLTFRALQPICDARELVWIAPTGFNNRISSEAPAGGFSEPIPFTIVNITDVSTLGQTVFAGLPGADIAIPTDAGSALGSLVTEPTVTASNGCGDVPVIRTIDYPVSSGLPSGSTWPARFPIGSSVVTWEATDALGRVFTEIWIVEVFDYQIASIDIDLVGGISPALSYTLPIRVRLSSGDVIATTVDFTGNNGAIKEIQVPVRDDYTCISVKDATHTVSAAQAMSVVGTRYEPAAFALVAGDSNDDDLVDVLDFGAFVADRGIGKTPQSRSNFDRNPVVNNGDFTFIALNFFRAGDSCGGGFTNGEPRERVSVRDLRRAGLGYMADADINGDGWVDSTDMALAMQGIYKVNGVPTPQAESALESPNW
ncbi:MAG: hypothetical protein RLZZ238_1566, partial [Planctomycetota bacterium]